MNFLKRIHADIKLAAVDEITLPGTKLTYDKSLLSKLKKNHRKLLRMHATSVRVYDKKKFDRLSNLLRQIKIKYTSHLLLENTRFFTYLKHFFKEDTKNTDLIRGFVSDMDKQGKLVFQFLDRSTQEGFEFDEQFKKELEIVGKILKERFIANEKELHFLYQPPET